jgi:acetyl esterase/lipase
MREAKTTVVRRAKRMRGVIVLIAKASLMIGTIIMALDPVFAGKLDADMQKVLETQDAMGARPVAVLSPDEARAQPSLSMAMKAVLAEGGKEPDPTLGITTQDLTIPGPVSDISARLYAPQGHKPDTAKPLPVVVYFHGGGFVFGGLDGVDGKVRAIASRANCLVVSCAYRLAPEYKFPAAHMDAFAAYSWVVDNAASFGGAPKNVAVMGESAGANLAANVAILARDSQHKPGQDHAAVRCPVYMVLVYPMAGADMTTPSYEDNPTAVPLNQNAMAWFFDQALETDGDRMDPMINLVDANLSGLPDATVILAELDPLRSEGEALAGKLEDAGAEVRSMVFKGVPHGFFGLGRAVKKAFLAEEMAVHNLKRAFGTALLPI